MRSALAASIVLLLLILAACGSASPPETNNSGGFPPTIGMAPTTAPVPEPTMHAEATKFAQITPVPQPTVVVAGVADAPAVTQLTAALRERGLTPEITGESRVDFLADVPGQAYRLGEGWLYLHLYPNAEAASAKTAEVRRGLENPVADWGARPHAFRCDRLIALYSGTDEHVITAFTELCGPQFAGVR